MRIDFDRRVLRRRRRAIVDLAREKARVAHENSHGYRADESGLVGAQSRSLALNRTRGRGQAGRVHRGCCGTSGPTARIRRRIAINHEAAWLGGELLRPRRRRVVARATGARSA